MTLPNASDSLIERLRRATIGRYDIYAELGAGGMATVYLALDLALDRKVAIKVLSPALAMSPDNVERFKREAKVAASLNHPNIIGILAVGDDPDLAYFVMKYVEGRALDSVVTDMGAQSVPFVRGVIGAAGRALHYAHSRGVIHRDVKPANFMLDTDGWLVVTDFGIAKMGDAKGLTMTGSVVGTPYYMAPEQFQGKPVTAAADQYALGIVAFELLTGRQPFAGDTVAEVMKGHLFDPIPSVRTLRPDVPETLDATITRMLSKEPGERFANLEEAVAAFGAVTATQESDVRAQMLHLALSGAMAKPQVHVPISPSPVAHPRPSVSQVDRTMPGSPPPPSAAHPMGTGNRRRSLVMIAVLALLVGGALATAALRPDLVNRLRKSVASGPGDLADTARLVTPADPPVPAETSVASVDSVKRAQELRDSIEQEVAAAMRDSLARLDRARRVETAVPAPAPPAEIPSTMVFGVVRIGSNCPGPVLLVNGQARRLVRRRLLDVQQLSGEVRLSVRTLGRARWDTTMTVESGVTYTIGLRPLRCQ